MVVPNENHENEGLPDEDENLGLPDEDENLRLPGEDETFDDVEALLQDPYVNVEACALVLVQDPPNVAGEQTNFKTLWCENSLFFCCKVRPLLWCQSSLSCHSSKPIHWSGCLRRGLLESGLSLSNLLSGS